MNDNTENKMRNKMKKVIVSLVILFQVSITNSQTSQNDMPVLKGPYLSQTPQGYMSQIFAPGFVSTQFGELNSVFTADGKEFYFSRRGIPGIPLEYSHKIRVRFILF